MSSVMPPVLPPVMPPADALSATSGSPTSGSPTPPGANAASSQPLPRRGAPAWLREPLLHFLLAGAALFALDHALVARQDDPRTIVMGAAVDKEARDTFKAARGREPDAKELAALRQVWLDNEVLYREGLAMQVDRGDTSIRDRVIFKALSIVDANLKLPAHDDAVLRAWFNQHRSKYDEPARYDFHEAVPGGDSSETALRALAEMLNTAPAGEAKAGLRVFKGRPQANIDQSYGPDFTKALAGAPVGEWRVLSARDGWHVVRLEAVSPGVPAEFERFRGPVLQDWTDEVMAAQRTEAVRALARKYTLRTEEAAP